MAVKPLIPVEKSADILNQLSSRYMGNDVDVAVDLSNIAEFGKSYDQLDSGTKRIVTSEMITLVTKQLFVSNEYRGNGVNIIRPNDSAYTDNAGIIQKNRAFMPDAVDDSQAYDPEPLSTNDPFVNYPQELATDYYDNQFQYRYQWSQPDRWLTGMFLEPGGMSKVVSLISQQIDNAIKLNIDNITMSTIRASMILNLNEFDEEAGAHTPVDAAGGPRAINVLGLYNDRFGETLTPDQALQTPDFLRYAVQLIFNTFDQLRMWSDRFNEKAYPTSLDASDAYFLLLSEFRRSLDSYLYADTYHKELVELPYADTIASWSGNIHSSGESSMEIRSRVHDSVDYYGEKLNADTSYVIGTIFDQERCGIYNMSTHTEDMRDPVGLKTNHFIHIFGQAIMDPYANAVTFYMA